MSSFPAFAAPLPKLALGAAAVLAALSPGSAQGYVVTVGQLQYDVTTFTGRYDSQPSKFNNPPSGLMPWWGSKTATDNFVAASGTSETNLYANLGVDSRTNIILYAFGVDQGSSQVFVEAWGDQFDPNTYGGVMFDDATSGGRAISWARAALYTAPAPGPLPLFGAGAAFGFSRKLRKRIQESRRSAGSGQPLA